jgi:hypothetical protein
MRQPRPRGAWRRRGKRVRENADDGARDGSLLVEGRGAARGAASRAPTVGRWSGHHRERLCYPHGAGGMPRARPRMTSCEYLSGHRFCSRFQHRRRGGTRARLAMRRGPARAK